LKAALGFLALGFLSLEPGMWKKNKSKSEVRNQIAEGKPFVTPNNEREG
jgi:hypothetical protein